MNNGKVFLISGPSGVGKGTIREYILNDPEMKMELSISATTRQPREGEVRDVDYYYISEEEFLKKIDEDEFIEHVNYVGNRYGTLKSELTRITNKGHNVFLEIEILGALKVLEQMEVVSIFILPPSKEDLKSRLINRATESEEIINDRLKKAEFEIEYQDRYEYKVINDNLKRAVEEIKSIVKYETSI